MDILQQSCHLHPGRTRISSTRPQTGLLVRVSVRSFTGVADPRGMKRDISCPRQKVQTNLRVPHPSGFPVRLGGVNEPHTAFLIESRTRCHGWGRAVGNPGSFALLAKGGIPRTSIPTVAYPTLCKERQRMGHPPFRGASCRAKHPRRLNRGIVSYQSSTGVADPQGK
jgi:hypothetical protein